MTLLLIRHAWAGDRDEWQGDDRRRPLDARGARQSEALVDLVGRYPVARVVSSPYDRCVQTVQPLARARQLQVEVFEELSEERQAEEGVQLMGRLLDEDAVVCCHGGLSWALAAREQAKGEVLVLDEGGAVLEQLTPG